MNNVYFACLDCKILVDAGYRWAYWTLEKPGHVVLDHPVDARRILGVADYWTPPEGSDWLTTEVLPSVREFFEQHAEHKIRYGDSDSFYDELSFVNWRQDGADVLPLPRNLHEQLGLADWSAVSNYVEQQQVTPWWWDHDDTREVARRYYDELTKRCTE